MVISLPYIQTTLYIGNVKIEDLAENISSLFMVLMKFVSGTVTTTDVNNVVAKHTSWSGSPINLVTWSENGGKLTLSLNLPAIITLVTTNGGSEIDPGGYAPGGESDQRSGFPVYGEQSTE